MADVSIGLQKKIVELDPYKAEVNGDGEVTWSPDSEQSWDAGLVPVSVPTGKNSRYTVKVPLPVPGDGLEQDADGAVNVKYDPNTMEMLPDGTIAAKSATSAGVTFVHGETRLVSGWQKFEFTASDNDCYKSGVFISPDVYPAIAGDVLPAGDIVIPSTSKWIKVDALLTFSVEKYDLSIWEYDCVFSVKEVDENGNYGRSHDFAFSLDTTERISVVNCPLSIYNAPVGGIRRPMRFVTGITWNRSGETDMQITCNGKVTVTAI